ncbi:MAG: hypothetical protein Q4A74_06405 [Cardiobacteriaceae bacterium]|nr:hypothetical protein [Cardiobacteriaceae bacterium]
MIQTKISERLKMVSNSDNLTRKDDDCYWTLKDIAAYLNLSICTVRRNFISDPRWPAPLCSGSSRTASQRWLASEVKKALLLFRRHN